jgi:hypothetical protein
MDDTSTFLMGSIEKLTKENSNYQKLYIKENYTNEEFNRLGNIVKTYVFNFG